MKYNIGIGKQNFADIRENNYFFVDKTTFIKEWWESGDERTLEDTAQSALRQIEEKNYDAELLSCGIEKERIKHYGFAFEGKRVLIAE